MVPVPSYAYLNVSIGGSFNLAEVLANDDGHTTSAVENPGLGTSSTSTGGLVSSMSENNHPEETTSLPPVPSSTSILATNTHSGLNKMRAIAEVVGSAAVFMLIAGGLGIWWFWYRKRRQGVSVGNSQAPVLDKESLLPTPYPITIKLTLPAKLYDPSIPTTYPVSDLHMPVPIMMTPGSASFRTTFGGSVKSKILPRYPTNQIPEL
ncbi:hypothetical protein AMATHDRAFT_3943 [Amanita thiersii Skay4041]|uniref:Mid2 domain-containing protein n=1 Tax=Amanita thiersii Skay4041 TaxID=703135 RepID=A0A2A9NRS1_9AGAR|nr:hypothetical protein AMATHDRAFT_3943 [Amanita thiersii Skay4041]